MENVNFFIVFIEGVLSIFSPCILPILPVYLSMLSNSSIEELETSSFKKGRLLINTIFFVFGISITFFILGSSINAFSSFFKTNKSLIMLIGGLFIIFMGLFYLGVIKSSILSREKKFNVNTTTMNPFTAFILGFSFSFGWTPCIGPILASVLVLASSSENIVMGNLLILTYTLGFILPFLLVSLFCNKLMGKFHKAKKYMKEIKSISGAFIIITGVVMVVNGVININKELKYKADNEIKNELNINENIDEKEMLSDESTKEEEKISPINFTLKDQYGNEHTLSNYKGKTVFLNFWATWCPPCRAEMPYIEELYKEYNNNEADVVILGVASPNLGDEGTEDYIKEFLDKEGFTFPVVFDEGGSMMYKYGMGSLPSTLIIDKEGYVSLYYPGGMDKDTMKRLIGRVK